jgi:hypothetical protein
MFECLAVCWNPAALIQVGAQSARPKRQVKAQLLGLALSLSNQNRNPQNSEVPSWISVRPSCREREGRM